MKMIATKIDFTKPEHDRIVAVGEKMCNGVKVSFRSLCKRLVMQGVEREENGANANAKSDEKAE